MCVGVSKSCYLSFSLCVWRANIVVRNQLQLFILHIETHRPTIKCATEKAVHRVQAERRTPGTQFDSLFHITILTRWRYHYKLHGINIHLPIYSMSCGSNTIHVLLLHPLHTDCVCVENGRNRKIVSICGCTFSPFEPGWALSHLIYLAFVVRQLTIHKYTLSLLVDGQRKKHKTTIASHAIQSDATTSSICYMQHTYSSFYQCRRLAK